MAYVVRHLLSLGISLFLISVLVFLALRVLPGDPAEVMLGTEAEPESLARVRAELGLDRPLPVQYAAWARGLLVGDLGESLQYGVAIGRLITSRLSVTVPLAALAIAIAVALGVPLGLFAARHRGRLGDYGVMVLSQLGLAIPSFWLGLLLILLFAVRLGWFSAGGFVPWSEGGLSALRSLLLPGVALGLIRAAVVARISRGAMLEVLQEDYLRTARAKGLSERKVLWKHALRNALFPVVTSVGLQFAALLAGTIVIENVFYLPGLGRFVFQAIGQRDLPVVQDIVVVMAGVVVVVNLLVDLGYALLDPRVRLE